MSRYPRLLDQRLYVRERTHLTGFVRAADAQQADHRPEFGQRGRTLPAHLAERGGDGVVIAADGLAADAGLQGDHRERVADGVVQLPEKRSRSTWARKSASRTA